MFKLSDEKKLMLYSALILIGISFIAIFAASEIYAKSLNPTDTLKAHFEISLTVLMAIVGGSILLLYSQVLPLVRKLIQVKRDVEDRKVRLQTILDNIMEGIITTDNKGRITDANPAAAIMFQYDLKELIGKSIWYLIPQADDHSLHLEEINSYLTPGIKEVIGVKQNKQRFPLQLAVQEIALNHQHLFVGIMHDISDKKKTETELSYQAHYDALTGLLNRSQLEHHINASMSAADRYSQQFALIFLDIDYFKKINDTLGHDAGDEVLKIMAERLKKNIRKSDIIARIGGDEFVIILNGAHNPEIASIFADKMIKTVKTPFKIKDNELFITISLGIAFYKLDGDNINALLKSADLALYAAKEKGRNNYQFCTPEMNAQINEKIKLKNALKLAFQNNEFQLVYQPKMNLHRQRIIGFEAFLRWESQEYGNVSPVKIISLMDEMGMTIEVSQWIVKTACEAAKKWNTQSGITRRLTLNISAKYYANSLFVNSMSKIIEETKLSPKCLELEITESLIMHDPEYSLKTIKQLQEQGIDITIDNFGTGYSSLSYLHQFAVNSIKTDRKFTNALTQDAETTNFLRAMINLAKNLKIKVQAEGVESKEQYDLLFEMGCDEAQGYYIGRPMPYDALVTLIKNTDKQLQELN